MSEFPNVPQDIIIDILYCLPAKSIARFRCVSKSWLSILTNSKFIKTHLNINRQNQQLLVVYHSNSLHALTLTSQNKYVSRKLNFPPDIDRNWFEIVGSCGGLVLALGIDENRKGMFLMNPTSSKYKKLPEIPFHHCGQPSMDVYGFGYDEYSDDFKVVTLSYYYSFYDEEYDDEYDDDDDEYMDFNVIIDVYSLKANCWRRIEGSPLDNFSCEFGSGVLLHGAIHWTARMIDYSPLIAAFDLNTEKFTSLEVPNYIDYVLYDKYRTNELVVLDCCLGMITQDDRRGFDVWMMKEYGIKGSWIKLIRLSVSNGFDISIPASLVEDDDLVVSKWENREVEIFNVKERRFRSFIVGGGPAMVRHGCAFVESLVSPHPNC